MGIEKHGKTATWEMCNTKKTWKAKEIAKYENSPIWKNCNMERVHHKEAQHKKVQHKDSAQWK